MADNRAQIIIKKKINKGGHGHHGGAWKVAYADFVTAMMAFFLVMWLMGADEVTKAKIAQYFNHPNTSFDPDDDPNSNSIPRPGLRDSLLSGMEGAVPDDQVPNPVRAETYLDRNRKLGERVRLEMDGQAFNFEVEIQYLKFSIPEAALFAPGTSQLRPDAKDRLNKLGDIFKNYGGNITVEDYTNETQLDGSAQPSAYVASTIKAVVVMNYLIENNYVPEDRIRPIAGQSPKSPAQDIDAEANKQNKRIEFTLAKAKKVQ
jgi:chemotaxis protein MotB